MSDDYRVTSNDDVRTENVRAIPVRASNPPRPAEQSSAEHDVKEAANSIQQTRLRMWQTLARKDALTIVERARERAGFARTAITDLEADTVHMITDLLLKIHSQEVPRA